MQVVTDIEALMMVDRCHQKNLNLHPKESVSFFLYLFSVSLIRESQV